MIMQRKAAIVMDTMCKLVKDPEEIAPFVGEVIPDLTRNAEEIADLEVRERTAEALNTVKVAMGEALTTAVQCDKVEVEAVLSEQISGNAYNRTRSRSGSRRCARPSSRTPARARTRWWCPTRWPSCRRPRPSSTARSSTGAAKFGAGQEEEVVEDHDDLAVLCDCSSRSPTATACSCTTRTSACRQVLRPDRPQRRGQVDADAPIAAGVVEGFPKEIRSVYVECTSRRPTRTTSAGSSSTRTRSSRRWARPRSRST